MDIQSATQRLRTLKKAAQISLNNGDVHEAVRLMQAAKSAEKELIDTQMRRLDNARKAMESNPDMKRDWGEMAEARLEAAVEADEERNGSPLATLPG